MRPSTLARLALAGSTADTLRVALTAFGAVMATLMVLATGTVLSITGGDMRSDAVDESAFRYTNNLLNEAGLRPGVSIALVLLTIPVLFFAAQCARIGAPARDRRLAALRMAGATPRQVRLVAAVETGVAALFGTGLGVGAFLGGRLLLDNPGADGRRALPTDVLPPTWLFVAVVVGLPVLATLLAVWLLRRVVVTPFGVVRHERPAPPHAFPGVLLVIGVAGFGGFAPATKWLTRHTDLAANPAVDLLWTAWLFLSFLCLLLGIVLSVAWVGHRAGRFLHRRTGRASLLIATRRLAADPWSGSRTLAVVLAAVVVGVGAAMLKSQMATQFRAEELASRRYAAQAGEPSLDVGRDTDFYFRAFELLNYAVLLGALIAAAGLAVVLTEGIVTRRRTLTSLVAAGTPRGVLVRATLWQVLIPLVPGVLLAVGGGWLAGSLFEQKASAHAGAMSTCQPAPGDPMSACEDPTYFAAHSVSSEGVTVELDIPVPWQDFVFVGGGAIAMVLAVSAVSLLFLRSSTDVSELRTT